MIKTLKTFFIFFCFSLGIFFADFASAQVHDLEVVSIATSPSEPLLNKLCDVIITVKSINPDPIVDNDGVDSYTYDFDDFGLSEIVLPDISAASPVEQGGTFQYTIKGVFNEIGEKALSFNVNASQGWPETRLINNDLRVKTTVITGYDLEASSLEMQPANPYPGQRVRFTASIKNTGLVNLITSTGLKSVGVNFDDFDLMDLDTPNVSVSESYDMGSSLEVVFEGDFDSSGEKILNFTIDYDDALEEVNEDNNLITTTVNIVPLEEVDITVDSLVLEGDDDGIMTGDDVEIIITIENSGNVSLTEIEGINRQDLMFVFEDFLDVDVEYVDFPSLDEPLDPGEIFKYAYKGSFNDSGEKKLTFTVDRFDDLIESSEDNNYIEETFYIYSSQDEIDQFEIIDSSYSLISSTSAMISWSTSKETTGEVWYRRDFYNNYNMYIMDLRSWPSSDTEAMEHSLELVNLFPDEKYVFEIKAFRGEVEDSTELFNFTTPVDDSVQLVGGLSEKIDRNTGSIELTWNTNIISSGHVYYKVIGEGDYISLGLDDLTSSHNVVVEDLESGDYEYYIESVSGENSYKSDLKFFVVYDIIEPEEEPEEDDTPEDEPEEEDEEINELSVEINNEGLHSNLKGKIMLKVEDNGEAYYIHPDKLEMYYLGRPDDAFSVMRDQGVGITNDNLEKIPVGLGNLTGPDTDGDGLPDLFEDAIGTDKNSIDTDNDGFGDKDELNNGYNPNGSDKLSSDSNFSSSQAGKIFLQVENNGEAWYINPEDNKRYFLGRPADAFSVMRNLGLGISNSDFDSMR